LPSPLRHGRREHDFQNEDKLLDKTELAKIERYLRQKFANHAIKITGRPKKSDSADVYLGEEQIGTVSVDDEDGDRSFILTMPILDVDLED
jgi:hypothetical protein